MFSQPILNFKLNKFIVMIFVSFFLIGFLELNLFAKDEITIPNTKWDIEKGKRLFHHYCAHCHGKGGKGDGPNAVNLDPKPRDFTDDKYMVTRTDQNLFDVISKGGAAIARSTFMPPFDNTLSKEKILDIIAYIRSFAPIIRGPEITEAKKTPAEGGKE
ncbi:MAG: cytochrome c [Nitrospinota bacterium]